MSFQKKLFVYLSSVLIIFTISVLIFQYEREKNYKEQELETSLNDITELTHKFIVSKALLTSNNFKILDSLKLIIPREDVRITIISSNGKVLYDSEVSDISVMENHKTRPEIRQAVGSPKGSSIRTSHTTGNVYYYYARFYSKYFVRTAAHYDVEVKGFLKVEKLFIFFLATLFVVMWIILFFLTRNISETIEKLSDFVGKLTTETETEESLKFPKDELGIISSEIFDIYKKLSNANKKITLERNKLFSHLHALNEGIAFFSSERKKILANNHFIQYLNLISGELTISANKFFDIAELKKISSFIEKNQILYKKEERAIEINLIKNNNHFNVQCVIFSDKSFEIVIKNTTKSEKRRIIKQQMTSNIAHELKTPVATVMGYLETLTNNNIDANKKADFIQKAFQQAQRLSSLIEDISMLNKIEETKEFFEFESVNIKTVIAEVQEHLQFKLEKRNIKLSLYLDENIEINGNKSLLFSVFYNLFDNAIKYGNENGQIIIKNYLSDKQHYYFSFANTGDLIEKQHLTRIFERFYRVDDGRSRKTGGTGLGLAIVKNAIKLHNGTISARDYNDQGLEFLFTLAR